MQNTIQHIDIDTLKARLDTEPSETLLIDVREQHEWDAGHIPGAHHLPKSTLLDNIHALAPAHHTPIYLQCKAGGRSMQAAQLLLSAGYTQIFNVTGGISAWQAAGLSLTK